MFPRKPRCGFGLLGTWLTKTFSDTWFPQNRVTADAAAYSQLRLYACASDGKLAIITLLGSAVCCSEVAVGVEADVALAVVAVIDVGVDVGVVTTVFGLTA